MTRLHIVQGGIKNRDKDFLEGVSNYGKTSKWIVPKSCEIGDDIVIFIGPFGFFATGRIKSPTTPSKNWPNRYSADLANIRLIKPPISLFEIRRHVTGLKWANYPRSITTPPPAVADEIRRLIRDRRRTGLPDLDDESLDEANIDELRRVALLKARPHASARRAQAIYRARSRAIARYVIVRSKGHCEACKAQAPFRKPDGTPYLEPHHTTQLSDDGPDHPKHVIALCPTCHRRAHHSANAKAFNRSLIVKVAKLELR
jgi:hypothetical protein